MATEHSPLLRTESERIADHNQIYDKFSPWKKRIIVSIVSWAGFVPLFVGGSFTPTIPQIARDLESDGATISWAISLSILTSAIASMIWASYSGFYGRRPIYIWSMPFLCLGSLGVAQSMTVSELMIWRVVQAFGCSSGGVGPAVIGDIYKLEERGTAMGIFLATSLLGPSLSPLVGGIFSRYASWRLLQYVLAVTAFISFFVMRSLLPETCHPDTRGIDKLKPGDRRWVWINPFNSLWLLRSPNLFLVTMSATASLISIIGLVMPLAYTIGERYDIKNEAVLAIFFSAVGTGNIFGAAIAGRISDQVIIKWRKRRLGKWVPEDRLRAALFAAGVMTPVSVLLAGIVTQYVPGPVGLGINFVCLFINGVGTDMILTPIASYLVDVLPTQSAEIMSSHGGVRALLLAAATTATIPMINSIGVMITDGIYAVLCWVGFLCLWFTIRYGDEMRAWIDVGYATIEET